MVVAFDLKKGTVLFVIFLVGIFLLRFYSTTLFIVTALFFLIIMQFIIFVFTNQISERFEESFYYLFGISFLFAGLFDMLVVLSYPGYEILLNGTPHRLLALSFASRFFIIINSLFIFLNRKIKVEYKLFLFLNAIFFIVVFFTIVFNPIVPSVVNFDGTLNDSYYISELIFLLGIIGCIIGLSKNKESIFKNSFLKFGVFFFFLSIKSYILYYYIFFPNYFIEFLWLCLIVSTYQIFLRFSRLAVDEPIDTIFSVLKEKEQDLIMEIEKRTEIEEALAESVERIMKQNMEFQEIIDNAISLIYIKDTKGKYLLTNRAFRSLFKNVPFEFIGKTDYDFFSESDAKKFNENDTLVLESQENKEFTEYLTLYGTKHTFITVKFPLFMDGRIYAIGGVSTDITERLMIEESLWRSQKLESLGFLASGIAHDFNNYLMSALSYLSFIEMEPENADEVLSNVEAIKKALNQSTSLTKQLITFAKGGVPVTKPIQLDPFLHETVDFIVRGKNAKVIYDINESIVVEIDPNQMAQAIQNLVLNAYHAIQFKHSDGLIKVTISQILTDDEKKTIQELLNSSEFIKISIQDNGIGIPQENMKRIFDPYFTTKEKGVGLGLSTTYSIVKRHKGHIHIKSEEGVGTTATIYLPLVRGLEEEKIVARHVAIPVMTGNILIMDDESLILDALKRITKKIGFSVETATNGSEAVQKYFDFKKNGKPFDLLIMDLTVPGGMGGKEAMEKIISEDPEALAIVSTGYSSDPVLSNPRAYGFSGVLSKPYALEDLYTEVSRVMGLRKAK